MSRLQDLPLLHPSLTLHLSDNADTPIISSAPPPTSSSIPPSSPQPPPPTTTRPYPRSSRSSAISSLNRSALASYTTAQRLGLGNPVRIMVECASSYHNPEQQNGGSNSNTSGMGGPMVLNTYIPPLPQPAASQVNGAESSRAAKSQLVGGYEATEDADDGSRRPPLLVAVVVAPDGESQTVADARLAASRLARVGRRLQATWAEEEGGQGGEG